VSDDSTITGLQSRPSIAGNEKIPCAYGDDNWALTPNQLRSFIGTGGVGSGSDVAFVFDQMSASATWLIAHGLGKYPSVTIVDSSGATVEGAVDYVDANSLTVSFSAAFAGTAYLN
jgi:hypothetical protein